MEPCLKSRKFHVFEKAVAVILGLLCLNVENCRGYQAEHKPTDNNTCRRKHSADLRDFGGVGDGKTLNTKAFKDAIDHLSKLASDGGAKLVVPPGKWLTGGFDLSSNFTLFLEKDAIILATQNESEWSVVPSLPSYGDGKDPIRYQSFISGSSLTDVVITGNNGTIDGQGASWWEKFTQKKMKIERPLMIEIMYSDQIQISNITLVNSTNWFIHPVYSSNIIIKGVTILAPTDSPNTDGIDPDSCTNTQIEDCYIVSGDDCIAVKSGFDQYGIKFGMPTKHLIIKNLTCISPTSAAIAIGSEMSGGVEDVRAEDITAITTESAVRIKTGRGRGGYVRDIFVRRMNLDTMKYVFWMTGSYGSHSPGYDPSALPMIEGINYKDVVARNVSFAGFLEGIEGDSFKGICISNATMSLSKNHQKQPWNCSNVEGFSSSNVSPKACRLLKEIPKLDCAFPGDSLPIDDVQLKTC